MDKTGVGKINNNRNMDEIRAQYNEKRVLRDKKKVENIIQKTKEFVKKHKAILQYYDFFDESNREELVKIFKSRTMYIDTNAFGENNNVFIDFYKNYLYKLTYELERAGCSLYKYEEQFVGGFIEQFKIIKEHTLQKEINRFKAIRETEYWVSLKNLNQITTNIGLVSTHYNAPEINDYYFILAGNSVILFGLLPNMSISYLLFNKYQNLIQIECLLNKVMIKAQDSSLELTLYNQKQSQKIKYHYVLVKEQEEMRLQSIRDEEDRKQKVLNNTVNNTVENLLKDVNIKTMGRNFIQRYFKDAFLDEDFFKMYETCIYNMIGQKGKSIFISDVKERELWELPKELYMFYESLGKVYTFESEEVKSLSCWRLLYNLSNQLYSQEWQNLYGEHFLKIQEMDLASCLNTYCTLNVDISVLSKPIMVGRFVYFLMDSNKFEGIIDNSENYLECFNYTRSLLVESFKQKRLEFFMKSLIEVNEPIYTINDIDLMTGLEFETFVSSLFNMLGYATKLTKASGDQGIDVIAEKNNYKIGIQAKCYSGPVSNKAIQEVVAGLAYYQLDKGLVVTNNYFTDSAIELAVANDIILWDRKMLKEKIDTF